MKKQSFIKVGYLFLAGISLLALTACGKPMEAPESVINKAKTAIVDISSGHVVAAATAKGGNGTDGLNFDGKLDLAFDKKDETKQKADLHLTLTGDLKSAEKNLNGELDFNFVTLEKQYYAKLNKLSTSDQSLTQFQPIIDLYKGKWLRIAEDFIPENIRNMQTEDEAAKLKQQKMKDLFVETNLFDVTKEYGVEKLNGRNVYHYGLSVNMDGFKDYMAKAAVIDGRELTTQEIEEAVKILDYIKVAEIYVDTDDYYVLKAVFQFSGEALNQGSNLVIQVTVDGSNFNESVTVKAPEGAEEFNPLGLMMGLGGVPATTTEGEGTVAPEATTGEESVTGEPVTTTEEGTVTEDTTGTAAEPAAE